MHAVSRNASSAAAISLLVYNSLKFCLFLLDLRRIFDIQLEPPAATLKSLPLADYKGRS